jgi:hypothetical protein
MLLENIPQTSDKTLHFIAYLILVFLIWLTINPNKKVNWRKATAWLVILVVAGYGAVDEWLQGYVGRDPDVMDFIADIAAAFTGLILLSIFPFWPAFLVLTGAVIFILTNFMQAGLAEQLPVLDTLFHLFGYILFSLLWARYMHDLVPIRPPQLRWLIGILVVPIGFLMSIELFSTFTGYGTGLKHNSFKLQNILLSVLSIAAVAAAISLTALIRGKLAQKLPTSEG